MAVVSSGSFKQARTGGKLVDVPVPGKPGLSIRMYEDEAIAQGLWPPADAKAAKPVRNKRRTTSQNKVGQE